MTVRNKALGRPKGAFAATTLYIRGDVVNRLGALYAAKETFTSTGSFVSADWDSVLDAPTAVALPTTLMNYKGAWSAGATYVRNDLVSRAYALYVALSNSSNSDPTATSITTVGSYVIAGESGASLAAAESFYIAFTTAGSPVTLDVVSLYVVGDGPTTTGTGTLGIATAVAATPAATTFLASGSFAIPATAGLVRATLNSPVTLAANTTYFLVGVETSGRGFYNAPINSSGTASGGVASIGNTAYYTSAPGDAWAVLGGGLKFSFRLELGPSWEKIANTSSQEVTNPVPAATGAITLPDVDTATIHRLTLTGNTTLTFPAISPGKSFTVVALQDATGGRTLTWPATVKWPGDVAPTLTATANKRDVFTFMCENGTSWLGFVAGQNYSI